MNDPENIHERFEAVDDDFCNDDLIPEADKLHPSSDLCGLLKVASLMKNPADFSLTAGHDIVYLPQIEELVDLSNDDILYLTRCGIGYDDTYECLYTFC